MSEEIEYPKIAILAIDDDTQMHLFLETLFKKNNLSNYKIYADPDMLLADLLSGLNIVVIDHDLKHRKWNGLNLMEEIIKRNRTCRCIIMSGHDDAGIIKNYFNKGGYKYLTKGEPGFRTNLINYINTSMDFLRRAYDDLVELEKTTRMIKNKASLSYSHGKDNT
jgi:FixJ family two-component response regulator